MIPRFDYNFSYWIVLWFLLYYFHYIKYSPKFWLIFSIIFSFVSLITMIYYKNPIIYIIIFFIIISIIKIYPLYLIHNKPYKICDFLFGIFLFIIYLFWLFINETNFINILKYNFEAIKDKRIGTPMLYYLITFSGNRRFPEFNKLYF